MNTDFRVYPRSELHMTEQTREEKEMAITVVSLALWGTTLLFITAAVLFLLNIISSNKRILIGGILLAIAGLNYATMKVMIGKMQADLDG